MSKKRLNTAESYGLSYARQEMLSAQKRLCDMMVELGLDPDKNYTVAEDGSITEEASTGTNSS